MPRKLLVVGAGGIGSELLKDLVLAGFHTLTVLDLDTIDLSNLNRQFLFRKHQVGMSKALAARERVLQLSPAAVEITALHADVTDARFDAAWFGQFDLVLNALDNLAARRHVNRMCLAAARPLIESGTAGYLGQVSAICGGRTECFECQPKPVPKAFPVCTIRTTPSQPIHCVVWGKMLFAQLFGPAGDSLGNNGDDAEENDADEKAQALRRLLLEPDGPKAVFRRVFHDDVAELAALPDVWDPETRPPPAPLGEKLADAKRRKFDSEKTRDTTAWTLADAAAEFVASAQRLRESAPLTFDKDDDDALDFVSAVSILRAHAFGIAAPTRFKVKEMAGNIIPAIATTNAIVAGLMVLLARRVLAGEWARCRNVYLARVARGRQQLLQTEALQPPNPSCAVCAAPYFVLRVDTSRFTLQRLVADVVERQLSLGGGDAEVTVEEAGRLLYDPDFYDLGDSTLSSVGAGAGKLVSVRVDDDAADRRYRLFISIVHDGGAELSFNLGGPVGKPVPHVLISGVSNGVSGGSSAGDLVEADGAVVVDDDDIAEVATVGAAGPGPAGGSAQLSDKVPVAESSTAAGKRAARRSAHSPRPKRARA